MKYKGYILALALLFGIYWISSKVRAGLMLIYSFGLPEQVGISGTMFRFILPITLTNRTATPLTINSLDMDVLTGTGGYIGRAYNAAGISIPANGTTILNIQVGCYLSDLLFAYPELRHSVQSKMVNFLLNGSVTAQGFRINVADSINIAIPAFSDFF